MASNVLAIVQAALGELGLFPLPTVVAAATDNTTMQALALLNKVGRELSARADWSTLNAELDTVIAAPLVTTGTIADGSAVITAIPTTAALAANTFLVTGTGVPSAARVISVDSLTQVTLSEPCSATTVGVALTFAQDTYPVPADFRKFLSETQWDRTNHWQVIGPMSPQEDQWRRSGIVAQGPRSRFRQVGRGLSVFRFWPPPTASGTPFIISTEYQSRYWAQDASAVPKETFTVDTDTCVYPDALMIAGLKFELWAAKGFDATAYFADRETQFQAAITADGIAPQRVNMNRRTVLDLISPWMVPDAGYGASP